jgi:hypothetical protein
VALDLGVVGLLVGDRELPVPDPVEDARDEEERRNPPTAIWRATRTWRALPPRALPAASDWALFMAKIIRHLIIWIASPEFQNPRKGSRPVPAPDQNRRSIDGQLDPSFPGARSPSSRSPKRVRCSSSNDAPLAGEHPLHLVVAALGQGDLGLPVARSFAGRPARRAAPRPEGQAAAGKASSAPAGRARSSVAR